LEHLLLVVVGEAEQGQGVLAHDHARRQRHLVAGAERGECVGGALQLQADPADLEDGRGQGHPRDPTLHERDHRSPPRDVWAATAASSRLAAPPRQMWQTARASESAASAGRGTSSSRSTRATMAPTCALSALPLPVTAAFTSLGVCSATGIPRRAATRIAMPLACAVPITVRTLCWLNTRSTATTSGRVASIHCSRPCSM